MVGRTIKKWWPIFVLPTFAAFVIGFLWPFIWGIYLSFCKFTTVNDVTFVGFSNYSKILLDNTFSHSFWLTVVFAFVSSILINVLAFSIALVLTKGYRGTNAFRSLSARNGFIGMLILLMWQQIGYMMIIYIAGLNNVSPDLIEAAQIDGATSRQILFKIKIPMIMPSVTICTFLTLTNGFKMFDQNLSLTGGDPGKQSQLLALNIYDTFYARSGAQWKGIGQAKAVVFFLLVVAIALIQLRATSSKEVQQ